jgi:hypothetical protein
MSLRRLRAAIVEWSPGAGGRPDPLAAVIAAWPGIVGVDVAAHTRPAEVVRDTLVIVTRSSAWSQQLSFLSDDVLRGLHELPDLRAVARLRFRVGAIRQGRRTRGGSATSRSAPRATVRAPLPPEASAAQALDRLQSSVASRRRAGPSCPACGAAREESGTCAPCTDAPAAKRMVATKRLMYDAPWLGFAGMQALVEGLRRAEYDASKRALLARWWEILTRVRWTKQATTLERRIASSYVLLQSGLEPDRVTPAVVRNLLGDELAALLDPGAGVQTSTDAKAGNERTAAAKKRSSRSTPIP